MADLCKQIEVEVADKVGKLAEVTAKLKEAGVNLCAMVAWADQGVGHMLAVADDNEKACAAVQDVVDKCTFGDAVCVKVPNTPGALDAPARKLADAGIQIRCVYSTVGRADEAVVVFLTDDNAKAAEIL